MSRTSEDWPASRVFHLTGGARAINFAGKKVELHPEADGCVFCFDSSSYGKTFSELKELGFSIVGVDFYKHVMEFEGSKPPLWMVVDGSQPSHATTDAVTNIWARISQKAFEQKNGLAWDISSRISHQLRTCTWRVKQLSDAYHAQLSARVTGREFKFGEKYNDEFSWRSYLAIQTYFIDAHILADYLAEFIAEFVFEKFDIESEKEITTIAGLGHTLKKMQLSDAPLLQMLKEITSEGGWLKVLADYRRLIVHGAPLIQAESLLYSVVDALALKAGSIPLIKIQLPHDPSKIKTNRANKKHFNNFDEQIKNYVKAIDSDVRGEDAMKYIVSSHLKLMKLAQLISEQSPYTDKEFIIQEEYSRVNVTR